MITLKNKLVWALESSARAQFCQLVEVNSQRYVVYPEKDAAFLDEWTPLATINIQFPSDRYLQYQINDAPSVTVWYTKNANQFHTLVKDWGQAIRDGKETGGLR